MGHGRKLVQATCPTVRWVQESLKDARLANAGMDDDQLAASRQTARLKHALDQANTALREAQSALDKVRGCRAGFK